MVCIRKIMFYKHMKFVLQTHNQLRCKKKEYACVAMCHYSLLTLFYFCVCASQMNLTLKLKFHMFVEHHLSNILFLRIYMVFTWLPPGSTVTRFSPNIFSQRAILRIIILSHQKSMNITTALYLSVHPTPYC